MELHLKRTIAQYLGLENWVLLLIATFLFIDMEYHLIYSFFGFKLPEVLSIALILLSITGIILKKG